MHIHWNIYTKLLYRDYIGSRYIYKRTIIIHNYNATEHNKLKITLTYQILPIIVCRYRVILTKRSSSQPNSLSNQILD